MQWCIKIFISYLREAQRVSGNPPPIIRSLELHWQPLVLHNTMEGCWTCSCWTLTEAAQCSARLLMMGGGSPETR